MQLLIEPINWQNVVRIGVKNLEFDQAFPTRMKQIQGSFWSPEHGCWLVPYQSESWKKFQEVFADCPMQIKKTTPETCTETSEIFEKKVNSPVAEQKSNPETAGKILIREHSIDRTILGLELPSELIPAFLPIVKNIHGRFWDGREGLWIIPNTRVTVRFIEKYLKNEALWENWPDMNRLPETIPPEKKNS